MKLGKVYVDSVIVGDRRPLDTAKVDALAESLKTIGLQQPIIVFLDDKDAAYLVAGGHRLEAARRLGWEEIDASFFVGDEIDRELVEIAENLHRSDLTALERDEQTARYIELTEIRQKREEESNCVQQTQKVGHRPQSGVRKAAREIGVPEATARKATKVAKLAPEVKEVAREVGLDDNRTALLEAAKLPTPEAQVAHLRTRQVHVVEVPVDEKQFQALVSAWDKAGENARQRFREYIDTPVMDADGEREIPKFLRRA